MSKGTLEYIRIIGDAAMPDCFISYAIEDEAVGKLFHDELKRHGLSVFMAGVTLKPGQNWSKEIMDNLRASSLILFLATHAACASPFVQQELGGALAAQKKVIPIVWDMQPSELPGWTKGFQALNLTGATIDTLRLRIMEIANSIKADRAKVGLVLGALVLVLLSLGG